MKYFIAKVDNSYVPPIPLGWFGLIDKNTLKNTKVYEMQKHMLLYTEKHMQMVFTDIITFPCFMVSKVIMEVIEKYDPFLKFSKIVLYSRERKISKSYYIPFLNRLMGVSNIMQIDSRNLRECIIVEVEGGNGSHVIMRMDLVESILRRDVVGIGLKEIKVF